MSENGGLLAVTTTDVVELQASEGLFDGIDCTCNATDDMKDLCHTAGGHEHLDVQRNSCNGLESSENCYTDSGISNSADMDIGSIELLDDSEANDEGCTIYEENQTMFATKQTKVSNVKDACLKNSETDNVASSLCSEPEVNGDSTVDTVLSEDQSAGSCTIYNSTCNIDECSHGVDNILMENTGDDSVQSNQHSVKGTGDDNVLGIKVDESTCQSDGPGVSSSRADDDIEAGPSMTEVMSTEVVNLPADKSSSEGNVAEVSENVVVTSAASCQPQSQPTFTTSHSVPRPSQHSRPSMGSYGSPPPSSSCPDDDDASKQQYVVNVHVNPGETFSVCVSDQVQLIQGTVIFMHSCIELSIYKKKVVIRTYESADSLEPICNYGC